MEQSLSWEAISPSPNQECLHILCNAKVSYSVHNSPPLASILSQPHPIYTFPLYFRNVYSSIIPPSTLRSSERFFISGLPTKIMYAFIISAMCATCHAHLILLHLVTLIILGEAPHYAFFSSLPHRSKYSTQKPVLYAFSIYAMRSIWPNSLTILIRYFYPCIFSSLLGSNILLNTLCPCSSPTVRDQVSHSYKTIGNRGW